MKPTKKLPLFCVTGASCAGKTTVCNELFKNERDYIVLESDIFWNDVYNTPEDDYRDYRSRWMKLAAYVSQIGMKKYEKYWNNRVLETSYVSEKSKDILTLADFIM